jgi:hypothetical protein
MYEQEIGIRFPAKVEFFFSSNLTVEFLRSKEGEA